MDDQIRYAVKVRPPNQAEPDWASLLAARVAPLLDASAVEVVTALVNHAPIAPDSSFEEAERLVAHLRTLGVTAVLVERPAAVSRRADVADRGTLKGLLPIPADTPEKGRNTQPFMFTADAKRPGTQPGTVAAVANRSEPPRPGGRAPQIESAPIGGQSVDEFAYGMRAPTHSAVPPIGSTDLSGTHGSDPSAAIASGHWGALTPARIQARGTEPGSPTPTPTPAPTAGWTFGGDTRPKTDSYQLDLQAASRPVHRQTQLLPEPELGEADTTHWTPVAPDPSAFDWPSDRSASTTNAQPPAGGDFAQPAAGYASGSGAYPAPGQPDAAPAVANPLPGHTGPHGAYPPPGYPEAHVLGGAPAASPDPSRTRSHRPTPSMPEMSAPQPVERPFSGPSGAYIPTSGPRPAIASANPDPLSHDPGMAALLSTFLPGMGQVYNGQRDRGIVFALTALFVVPWILGIVDAWHQATCIRRGEVPVPNAQVWRSARWSQLVLDIAVFTAILVAVDLWVGAKGVLRTQGAAPISAPLEP